jgi:hypothetical protein
LKTRNDLNGKKQVDADMLGKVSGARKDSHSLPSKNLDGSDLIHKDTAEPVNSPVKIFDLETTNTENTQSKQAATELHNITNSSDSHLRLGSLNDLHDTENLHEEGDEEDVAITVFMKDVISNPLFGMNSKSPSALTLHNPFDRLQEDSAVHLEENPLMDQIQCQPVADQVHAILEPVLNIPRKDVVLIPHKSTAKPGDLGDTERPSFLSVASASISSACELRPRLMPVPYTTMYAELSIDKRPFTTTHNSKTPTAAALKSVQILKQFWGDVGG